MQQQNTDLKHLLQYICALSDLPEPVSLKRLIDALRTDGDDEISINNKISELIIILKENPEYGAGFAGFILKLLDRYRQIALYTDMGIISDDGFAHSIKKLIGHRFLPLLPESDSVVELADYVFDKPDDELWLSAISGENWDELVNLIKPAENDCAMIAIAKNSILNALVVLSYRISGMGLHPDLMNAYPVMMTYSAAFVAQNQEAVAFANRYRQAHNLDALRDSTPDIDVDSAPLLVMLEQCKDIVGNIRKRVYKTGISIRMTNMLVRLEQSLHRMEILVELLTDGSKNRDKSIVELLLQTVSTAKNRYRFGHVIENNAKLLSRKVTENASRVGEHYISTDKAGYKKMYKKAAIGGLFIGSMATLKTLAYELVLAPFSRAFVNSMIYGLGFVSIHIAGGTVATKQPAMTAAAIASTISDGSGKAGKKKKQLNKLAELVVDIMRTQFVAILGNISIAMPVAFAIAYGYVAYYGTPMIDTKMAAHLLHDLDPIRSLSLPHAGIAGVFLFLAGLISGYYDNLASYNKIGERIKRHPLLVRFLPKTWLPKLAEFTEANLGAIMGNFIFGCFLGSTATIGYMLGLPLDIRHIAFASANFVHGLFFLSPQDLTWQIGVWSFIGVLLIGMVNLMVSFSLSLMVALRSKEVNFSQWQELNSLLIKHLLTHPLNFILPRSQSVKYAKMDSEGRIIFDENTIKETSIPYQSVMRRLGRKKDKDTPAEPVLDKAETDQAKTPLPKPDNPPQLPK